MRYPAIIENTLKARTLSVKELPAFIREAKLPRECIPTEALNSAEVWEALLEDMPMTAMIRNLGKMTSVGLLRPLSETATLVATRLVNESMLRKARVHPYQILLAERTYSSGAGFRGGLSWQPVSAIKDALNDAFYFAFKNVPETDKRVMLAIDVSGSMSSKIMNGPISAAEGAAAMAMVTAKKSKRKYEIMGFASTFRDLGIQASDTLEVVLQKTSRHNFGSTDCAAPMLYALERKIEVDAFCVYTDSETWYGSMHPTAALKRYRREMGIDARLAVIALAANPFSIADPNDAGMMDFVGFDASAPALLAEFIEGNV